MKIRIALISLLLVGSWSCQSYSTGLQESMVRTDETVVINSLRAIVLAERTYAVSNGGDYGTLKQLTDGGYLDSRFGGDKPIREYNLELKVTLKSENGEGSFTCNANPENSSAGRHFHIDSTSSDIHVNDTQPATASDKPLQ